MKVFVSTQPFGSVDPELLSKLEKNGIQVELNPFGRKITPEEEKQFLADKDGLIAGTEILNKEVLDCAPNLKIIARVGIGIDGIDFEEIRKRRILVTYTPEAVTQAVAELVIGNMLNLARSIHVINSNMKAGAWKRLIGFELAGKTIGIIGFGRVGQRVAKLIQGFQCNILVNDIALDEEAVGQYGARPATFDEIVESADVISIHTPKTPLTHNFINEKVLGRMKRSACLINTARGGIVNENDLFNALKNNEIASAAIDVYEMEPYVLGRLCELDNILLTSHSGSCSEEARRQMEGGAAEEIIRFHRGESPLFPVPDETIKTERSNRVIPINAEWHEIVSRPQIEENDRYKLYRKRWGQFPTHAIVGSGPLNLDIEPIANPVAAGARQLDVSLSTNSEMSRYMSKNLFHSIIDEIKTYSEPMAIKFGFRGDPLGHPEILEMIGKVREAGVVETIVTTSEKMLNETMIGKLVECGLDVLNLFVEPQKIFPSYNSNDASLCRILDAVRCAKAVSGRFRPKVRVFTEMDPGDAKKIEKFTRFWSHYSDVVAVVDPLSSNESTSTPSKNPWACSRLWQRIVITCDGTFVLCNYDICESKQIGKFPDISIQEAWNGIHLNSMRKAHLENRSGEEIPCSKCVFRKMELEKLKL